MLQNRGLSTTDLKPEWEAYLFPKQRCGSRSGLGLNGINDLHPLNLQMAEGQILAQEGSVRSIALETPQLRQDTRLCCQCQKSLMLQLAWSHCLEVLGENPLQNALDCRHRWLA